MKRHDPTVRMDTTDTAPSGGTRARLSVIPITLREAHAFVARHHRHHKPSRGGILAVGCATEGPDAEIVGVGVLGRPVARNLQDGWTAEVTRVATDGTANACSFIYGVLRRLAGVLGYQRLITYTLPDESGASLRGAGFRCVGLKGGGSWARTGRPRVDHATTQQKLRWETYCP